MSKDNFTYQITEHITTFRQHDSITKEINRISFNGASPKWDIRCWKRENGEEKMLKGITLTDEEFSALREAINGLE